MKIISSPVQGFTDAVWRNAHDKMFGHIDTYYAPFMRVEHGEIRKKDVRDIIPENNDVPHLVPQVLACGNDDMKRMLDAVGDSGYSEVDINLGCPYPPIAKKGKGCGMMASPEKLEAMLAFLQQYSHNGISISFKVRLGMTTIEEGRTALAMIDSFKPRLITIHSRLGVMQYKGEADVEAFASLIENVSSPVAYNGDLRTVDDIRAIEKRFPGIDAVMVGRGLLANPALAREYATGEALRIGEWLQLHNTVFYHFSDYLQGDAHILAKMKPFWEYAPECVERKVLKMIKKSVSVAKYQAAVDMLASMI